MIAGHTHTLNAFATQHPIKQVEQFLGWAEEDGFAVERVAASLIPEEYRVPDVLIVTIQLKDAAQSSECEGV